MAKPKVSTNWDNASVKHSGLIKKLEKEVPHYGYSDHGQAKATDEKLREQLVLDLRDTKARLFDIIQFLFELQAEKLAGRQLERIKDEVDALSDDIKVFHLNWKDLPESFLEALLKHDLDLLKGSEALKLQAEEISRLSAGYKKLNHRKEFDVKGIERVEKGMIQLLKRLLVSFKEREALFEVEEQDLERAYREIQKEIAQKFG